MLPSFSSLHSQPTAATTMHIPAIMFATSLSFSSIRFFKTRIPLSLYNNNKTPISKTSTFLSTPTQTLFSFKPITFQRLPTKPSSSSSSPPPSDSFQPIEDLPPKLQEIVKLFQSVQEPKAKYEQLLFYAKNLKPLDAQFKTDENKVEGCVSQVWVRAYLDQERNVFYEADSDSVLTKGLAALLVHGFSGRPVNEVLRVSPNFIVLLGLQQKLTVSRNNGFLNMLKLMQKKALLLYVEAEKGACSDSKDDSFIENSNDSLATQSPGSDVNLSSQLDDKDIELSSISSSDSKDDSFIENSSDSPATQSPGSDVNLSSELGDKDMELSSISSSDSKDDSFIENSSDIPATQPRGSDVNLSSELDDKDIELGGRGKRIKEKLEKELDPVELQIEDVSYQHAGHAGVRGSDGETHFNLKVVSKEFEGKSLVKRHRLIYNLLQEELQSGLHALSIVPKTPSEVNGG